MPNRDHSADKHIKEKVGRTGVPNACASLGDRKVYSIRCNDILCPLTFDFIVIAAQQS